MLDPDSAAIRDVRRRERIYRRALAVSDAVAVALAVLRRDRHPRRVPPAPALPARRAADGARGEGRGLYDKDELVIDHSTLNELPRLVNLATMLALLVWLARHFVVIGAPTTRNLLLLWVLLACGGS